MSPTIPNEVQRERGNARALGGRICVGIGGWSYEPWRETFYPRDVPKKNELRYASRHVTAIEINSTFYRLQNPNVFAKWRDETPEDFVFSIKAPRHIVQRRALAQGAESAAAVSEQRPCAAMRQARSHLMAVTAREAVRSFGSASIPQAVTRFDRLRSAAPRTRSTARKLPLRCLCRPCSRVPNYHRLHAFSRLSCDRGSHGRFRLRTLA